MTAPLTRQERRKQRTRRRLLDAARRVIARLGYESAGVLDITEEADVSKGTFYQYFKDKEALTHTLIVEGFEELRARADAIVTPERKPAEAHEALRTVFHYAAENRDLFRIMLGPQGSPELNLMAINIFADFVESTLVSNLAQQEHGPFTPALVAQFVAGAGVRLGLWWIEDDHGLSPDEISAIMFQMLMDGVGRFLPGYQTPDAAAAAPTAGEDDKVTD